MKTIITTPIILLICVSFSFAQISNPKLFELNFSNSFNDISTYKLTAEIKGAVSFTKNRFGLDNKAAYFNGEDTSYLFFGEPEHLKNSSEFSISIWYKGGTNNISDKEILINKFDFEVLIFDVNSPVAGGLFDSDWGPNAYDWDNLKFRDGYDSTTWHHLVIVKTNDSTYLYRDNQLRGKREGYLSLGENNLTVGKNFKGTIDNITIYDGVLNDSEINYLYTLNEDQVTGISEMINTNKVSFYPNPITDFIQFYEPCKVSLLDYSGQVVISSSNEKSLDLSNLPTGLYLLIINDNEIVKILKK